MTSGTPPPRQTPRSRVTRGAARRRRWRRLLPLAVAAWALAEIWLLTLVGGAAGGLAVALLLAAGAVAGAAVVRYAGRRAWQRLAEAARPGAEGRAPRDAPAGRGVLTMLGGLLLLVPGLLSDAAGLLCLFPPTAALLTRAGSRLLAGSDGPVGTAFQQARAAREAGERMGWQRPGRTVPGEVVREDDDPPRP